MTRGRAYSLGVAVAATVLNIGFFSDGFGPLEAGTLIFHTLFWLAAFVLVGIVALLPCLYAETVANRIGTRPPLLFIGLAVLTATSATVVWAWLMAGSDGDPEALTVMQALGRFIWWTLPAGVAGGVTYWRATQSELAPARM